MTVENAFFIWGEESYLINLKIGEIITQVKEENSEEPEVIYIDADDISSAELSQNLDFTCLFNLSRAVIIKNPAWLGKSSRKVKKGEEILKVLQDYFQRDNSGQVLIVTAPEHINTNPIVKLLDKQTQVINIKTLAPEAIKAWIKNEFLSRNLKIDPSALNALANSGQDMYYLENLIEKVSLINQNTTVGLKDIEEQLDSKQDIKIFKLTDAVLNRNLKAALTAFYQLQEQGQHPLLMIYMISRQLLTLAKTKAYQEMGYAAQQIAELTSQKEFVVKNMMKRAPNFSSSEIRELFKRLLEVDMSFKSESKDPNIIMETLLIEFCSKK